MSLLAAISVATININGLRDVSKRNIILDMFVRRKFDVIFLQETHTDRRDEFIIREIWKGDIAFSHGTRSSAGVAILCSVKSGLKLTNVVSDNEGRWVRGDIFWRNNTVGLMSVYAPNCIHSKVEFFDSLDKIAIKGDQDLIIGGDFNTNTDDNTGYDPCKLKLKNLMCSKNLTDIWDTYCPNDAGFTHFHKGVKKATRIDYVFMSEGLVQFCETPTISATGLSDHHIINVRMVCNQNIYGPGRWICNNSALKNDDVKSRIELFWNFWRTQKYVYESLLIWWDYGKSRLKEILRDYGRERAFYEKRDRNALQDRYNYVIEHDASNFNELQDIEGKLKEYERREYEKAKVRVRNIEKEEGERPTKFFFNLENLQKENKIMSKLFNEEGIFVEEPLDMITCVNNFYKKFYNEETVCDEEKKHILNSVKKVDCNEDELNDLEGNITVNQPCRRADEEKQVSRYRRANC